MKRFIYYYDICRECGNQKELLMGEDYSGWAFLLCCHPDKGINWIAWDNREFAKLVTKARQISDLTGRAELYQRAEKILTETEAVIVPLYFETTPFLVKSWVQNWNDKPFGGQHIRNWSLE